MPRPKKDGRYLNLYLDRTLHEEFEQFCESLGQTKTVASERALRMYMDAIERKEEKNYSEIIKEAYKKVEQIQKILTDEFPEVSKDRVELIANRLYDQMYEDKDV